MSASIPVDNTLDERRDARRDRQIAALSPSARQLFDIVAGDLRPDVALKLAQALIAALRQRYPFRDGCGGP